MIVALFVVPVCGLGIVFARRTGASIAAALDEATTLKRRREQLSDLMPASIDVRISPPDADNHLRGNASALVLARGSVWLSGLVAIVGLIASLVQLA
jgi:hypothetical protein